MKPQSGAVDHSLHSQWFNGPEFLRHPEETWPQRDDEIGSTTEDIRPSIFFHFAVDTTLNFERFSSWNKLLRATAYVLRFLFNITKPEQKLRGPLAQPELLSAE